MNKLPTNPLPSTSHSRPFLNNCLWHLMQALSKGSSFYCCPFIGILPSKFVLLNLSFSMKPNTCLVLPQVLTQLSHAPLKDQTSFLEKSTWAQSSSVLWLDHRIGHITAFVVVSVVKFKDKAYSHARVKSICTYYICLKVTKWSLQMRLYQSLLLTISDMCLLSLSAGKLLFVPC